MASAPLPKNRYRLTYSPPNGESRIFEGEYDILDYCPYWAGKQTATLRHVEGSRIVLIQMNVKYVLFEDFQATTEAFRAAIAQREQERQLREQEEKSLTTPCGGYISRLLGWFSNCAALNREVRHGQSVYQSYSGESLADVLHFKKMRPSLLILPHNS